MTLALPALMFRRILRGRSLAEQFLMCYTFGNFYIINIVFLLQLLHISNLPYACRADCGIEYCNRRQSQSDSFKAAGGKYLALCLAKLLRGRMKVKIKSIFRFPLENVQRE